MEEFLNCIDVPNEEVVSKLNKIFTLVEELLQGSSNVLQEFLNFIVKKYGFVLDQQNKEVQVVQPSKVEESASHWDVNTIGDDVSALAKQNLLSNGFIFDEKSGLYYDTNLQCYYNSEYGLYYHHETGSYYYYDEASNSLKYHSTPTVPKASTNDNGDHTETCSAITKSNMDDNDVCQNERLDNSTLPQKLSSDTSTCLRSSGSQCSDKEEGELSDDSDDLPQHQSCIIEAGPVKFDTHANHIAPCIRVLVTSSIIPDLNKGTLFVVTCTGGTLGREGDHDVLIPDQLVSKTHCSFQYVYRDGSYLYEIIDMGSRNGTLLNGNRLSQSLVQSEPFEVAHGSILTLGSTTLLCHIHPGDETCKDCEGYTSKDNKISDHRGEMTLRQQYCKELSSIRNKFGISGYEIHNPKYSAGYEDRSETRRSTVGSSHSSIKTEMASAEVPISKSNKGFALMTKMGWVEGTPLGNNDTGILEPLNLESNEGTRGLGNGEPVLYSNAIVKETKKMSIIRKTQERFNQVE